MNSVLGRQLTAVSVVLEACLTKQFSCVVDRHRFDADPEPEPTFHFDADPDPDPTPSFTHVGKSDFFFL